MFEKYPINCDLNNSLPLIANFFDIQTRKNLLGNKAWPLVGESIWKLSTPDDNEILQFPQKGYDLVIHGMSLHHSNDPIGQLI